MDGAERVSGATLLFRFGIGAAELAGERVVSALRSVDAVISGVDAEAAPDGALEPRHALLGAIAALPAWARTRLARRQAAARPARGRIARAQTLLSKLPGARRARRRTDALRAHVEAQLLRWAVAGRREELAGRALAAETIRLATHELVSAVAESPELKQVIAEQSESLGASAMVELREGSARADTLAERVARQFLRRSR